MCPDRMQSEPRPLRPSAAIQAPPPPRRRGAHPENRVTASGVRPQRVPRAPASPVMEEPTPRRSRASPTRQRQGRGRPRSTAQSATWLIWFLLSSGRQGSCPFSKQSPCQPGFRVRRSSEPRGGRHGHPAPGSTRFTPRSPRSGQSTTPYAGSFAAQTAQRVPETRNPGRPKGPTRVSWEGDIYALCKEEVVRHPRVWQKTSDPAPPPRGLPGRGDPPGEHGASSCPAGRSRFRVVRNGAPSSR